MINATNLEVILSRIRLKKWIKPLLLMILLSIILYESSEFLKNFNLHVTLNLLRNTSLLELLIFLILGLLVFSATGLYDYLAIKRLGIQIPTQKIIKVSWVVNSLNNITGGFPIGIGLRMFLYNDTEVKDDDINKINTLIYPALLTGIGTLLLFVLANYKNLKVLIDQHWWIIFILVGFIAYVPVYCWFNKISISIKNFHIEHSSDKEETITRILLVLVSTFDWIVVSGFFWVITRFYSTEISYISIIGIFCVASALGVLSALPGGIGVFDLMILLGLQYYGISSEQALAILLFFRIFYYLTPLIISCGILLIEYYKNIGIFVKKYVLMTEDDIREKKTKELRYILGERIVNILYIFIVSGGVILVISASTPGILERIKFLSNTMNLPVLQMSSRLSLLIGIIILLFSSELLSRTKYAWNTILVMLSLGVVFTFFKGMDYEEAIYLISIIIMLYLSKPVFYRKTAPIGISNLFGILLAIIAIVYYILSGLHFHYATPTKLTLLEFTHNDIIVNALIAFILGISIYYIWKKTFPHMIFLENASSDDDLEKVSLFLLENNGNELTHLIFMGDKKLFWACQNKVLFSYQIAGTYLVVLGEPIGAEDLFEEAFNEFEVFADYHGYSLCFYEATQKYMPLFHDYGYDFFKIGEEATVELTKFELSSPTNKSLRNVKNRLDREGFIFEILQNKEDIQPYIEDLKNISDKWLEGRKEKKFSLGFFDEKYLYKSSIAIIKDSQETIVAFANLMPSYREKEMISIDLMRHTPDSPNGIMDYLFLNLIIYSKNEGYKNFNLGMAPLLNVGKTFFSREIESLSSLVYNHGAKIYSFDGLFKYKNKFKPIWRPKYIVYKKSDNILNVIINLVRLIN